MAGSDSGCVFISTCIWSVSWELDPGIYGFVFGLLLAWGYESSSFGKYRMVVLMHGAANGAAVLCSMVFSGLF